MCPSEGSVLYFVINIH